MLACVLLAVATVPAASGAGLLSRPTAALVLRLSPLEARTSAQVEPNAGCAPRSVAPSSGPLERARVAGASPEHRAVAPSERLAVPPARARARASADERYLYLVNSTFLC